MHMSLQQRVKLQGAKTEADRSSLEVPEQVLEQVHPVQVPEPVGEECPEKVLEEGGEVPELPE